MSLSQIESRRIQAIRGLAIMGVLMSHAVSFCAEEIYVMPWTHSAVGVFLFLSGLLTSGPIEDIRAFYKKRILRVLYPYLIWSVIYTVLYGNYRAFLWNLLTGQCCSVYYYILVYMELTLLAPFLMKISRSNLYFLPYFVTPISLIIYAYLVQCGRDLGYPYDLDLFLLWLNFFYFGLRLSGRESTYRLSGSSRSRTCMLLAAFGFAISLEYVEAFHWNQMGFWNVSCSTSKITSMCTCLALCGLAYLWIHKSTMPGTFGNASLNVLSYFGDLSFGIYLTHLLFNYLWGKTNLWEVSPFYVRFLLSFGASAVFVYLLRKLLPKKLSRICGV